MVPVTINGAPMAKTAVLAIAFALSPSPVVGQPVAVDGNTIRVDGMTWRLWGIDAPEARQTCANRWPAGAAATDALQRLIRSAPVVCERRGRDSYGRPIGLCRVGGRDLGAELVSMGMAWAFIRYSSDYVEQERAAISARLGVHAHDCDKPWDWRGRVRGERH